MSFREEFDPIFKRAVAASRHNPDAFGETMEALASALAFAATFNLGKDPAKLDELLTGLTSYIFERAAEYKNLLDAGEVVLSALQKSERSSKSNPEQENGK